MFFTEPQPFTVAMQMARDRDVLPGSWDSDTLDGLEQALKRRAIFSARTTHADYLQDLGKLVDEAVKGSVNQAQFRDAAKRLLAEYDYHPLLGFPGDEGLVPPAEAGTLTDLSSDTRLDLIFDTQVGQAQGWSFYERGQSDSRLWQFPCWELIRVAYVQIPRGRKRSKGTVVPDPGNDWPSRWEAAGGDFFGGRMIARKDSGVWDALGNGEGGYHDALGQPYPPFAFNSGMGVREVPREECVKLGALEERDKVQAQSRPFNDHVEVPAGKYDPEILRELIRGCDDFLSHSSGKIVLANTCTTGIAYLSALAREIDCILANEFDQGQHPRDERGRFTGKVKRSGTWESLGLPSVQNLTAAPEIRTCKPNAARRLIQRGFLVTDRLGNKIRFDDNIFEHWESERVTPAGQDRRLRRLREVIATLKSPNEIWEQNKQRMYFKVFESEKHHRYVAGFSVENDRMRTFFHTDRIKRANHLREGGLYE